MSGEYSAQRFVERLAGLPVPVPMGRVFGLAKEFIDMPPSEIERLLDRDEHLARVGALSVMDKQARRNSTPEDRRTELYELYLRRPDRIDTWDLVDLGAPYVIGRYLVDKPRDVLYELARSTSPWERRTAIVACLYFVRKDQVDDTFAIAEILVHEEHDLVRKAVGGLLREAGKKDREQLLRFLDRYAAAMPRVMLRYAIEHLSDEQRTHYRGLKPTSAP